MVAGHSFCLTWYHKNIMSAMMANIYGICDAKPKGFVPGGMSLHTCMWPHGPDRNAFEGASNGALKAEKLDETTSYMFKTRFAQHLAAFAASEAPLQDDCIDCRKTPKKQFDGTPNVKPRQCPQGVTSLRVMVSAAESRGVKVRFPGGRAIAASLNPGPKNFSALRGLISVSPPSTIHRNTPDRTRPRPVLARFQDQ